MWITVADNDVTAEIATPINMHAIKTPTEFYLVICNVASDGIVYVEQPGQLL